MSPCPAQAGGDRCARWPTLTYTLHPHHQDLELKTARCLHCPNTPLGQTLKTGFAGPRYPTFPAKMSLAHCDCREVKRRLLTKSSSRVLIGLRLFWEFLDLIQKVIKLYFSVGFKHDYTYNYIASSCYNRGKVELAVDKQWRCVWARVHVQHLA